VSARSRSFLEVACAGAIPQEPSRVFSSAGTGGEGGAEEGISSTAEQGTSREIRAIASMSKLLSRVADLGTKGIGFLSPSLSLSLRDVAIRGCSRARCFRASLTLAPSHLRSCQSLPRGRERERERERRGARLIRFSAAVRNDRSYPLVNVTPTSGFHAVRRLRLLPSWFCGTRPRPLDRSLFSLTLNVLSDAARLCL